MFEPIVTYSVEIFKDGVFFDTYGDYILTLEEALRYAKDEVILEEPGEEVRILKVTEQYLT
jgi:hypothetical protein